LVRLRECMRRFGGGQPTEPAAKDGDPLLADRLGLLPRFRLVLPVGRRHGSVAGEVLGD